MDGQQDEAPIGFIDVEASGFGAGSYPIEIAFAKSATEVESHLVAPPDNWHHWSDAAERLHGITREQLLTEGLPPKAITQWLNRSLMSQTLYSDAWHYDFSWIHCLFNEVDVLPEFKIASIEEILTEEQSKLWAICKADVAASMQLIPHRAANDVKILMATYRAIREMD